MYHITIYKMKDNFYKIYQESASPSIGLINPIYFRRQSVTNLISNIVVDKISAIMYVYL